MIESSRPSIQIDLNEFKLHLQFKNRTQLTLHFNSSSRSFYLSVIGLVVNEMKKLGKIKSIPLREQLSLLVLLNESVGGGVGSSEKERLLHRIYRKWKDTLPNLEEAPLFRVLGKKKEGTDGAIGKVYSFTDAEKDGWANLFEYMGSDENVRLKFAIDKIGIGLDETAIIFGDSRNGEAWDQFIASLKNERKEESDLSPPPVNVASIERRKYALPDKPSIVVLPFVSISEDPKRDFFTDGLTEEIINALSRLPQIFVIARNSSFTYKGKAVDVKQVGRELGVQYLLEGSVRTEGNRIRVTAQLIDSTTGRHIFSERYDRELKDIFTTQDDITIKILTALRIALKDEELARVQAKGVSNIEAYFKLLEVRELQEEVNRDTNNRARSLAEEALLLDPGSSAAYAALAAVHFWDYWLGPPKSSEDSIQQGIAMAQKAIALDNNIRGHYYLAMLYVNKGDYDKAVEEAELAASMDPAALTTYGSTLNHAGRHAEAIAVFQKALRLNPLKPHSMCLANLGRSYRMIGNYEESVQVYRRLLQNQPSHLPGNIGLTATYSIMGRMEEARTQASEVLRINPKFSLEREAKTYRFKNPKDKAATIEALRKAGLK